MQSTYFTPAEQGIRAAKRDNAANNELRYELGSYRHKKDAVKILKNFSPRELWNAAGRDTIKTHAELIDAFRGIITTFENDIKHHEELYPNDPR